MPDSVGDTSGLFGRLVAEAYSYGSLMRAAAGNGDGATALALLEEMQTEGTDEEAVGDGEGDEDDSRR